MYTVSKITKEDFMEALNRATEPFYERDSIVITEENKIYICHNEDSYFLIEVVYARLKHIGTGLYKAKLDDGYWLYIEVCEVIITMLEPKE